MARATGFSKSKGDFVVFVDSDDKVKPTFIESLVRAQQVTGADITMCGYIHYDSELKMPLPATRTVNAESGYRTYSKDEMVFYYATQWEYWPHNNNTTTTHCKLFKRSILAQLQWREADYTIGEDDFETLYTFSKADKFTVINDQLYLYRSNPSSITNSKEIRASYQGSPISIFDLCHDFEIKAKNTLGQKYTEEIYIRVYGLYKYYIDMLYQRAGIVSKDIIVFDKFFPFEQIRSVSKVPIDIEMLDIIQSRGLSGYIENRMRAELDMAKGYIKELQENAMAQERELQSHFGIWRSVKLLAGNVKRRILNGKK